MRERSVNWALVGIGDIAVKRVAPAILAQPDSRLYACVTRDAEKVSRLPVGEPVKVYATLGQALEDAAVDAVYLATPVFLHAAQAIAALEAGKDVMVEKPMAMNASEARAVCETARRTGRRLAVAYFRRFWPRFERVKRAVESGRLGQIVQVRVALQSWYRPSSDDPKSWRVNPALGGAGVLADVGSHRLDLLAWWFGRPRRLVADCRTMTHDYQAEDSANLLMVAKSGAQIAATFHWNSNVWADEIHVTGTDAQLTLNPCDGDSIEWNAGRSGTPESESVAKPENAHFPMIDDFARAVVEDRPPRFTGDDGAEATLVLDAVAQSVREGKWVTLD